MRKTLNILVLEDDKPSRVVYQKYLQSTFSSCIIAASIEEALAVLSFQRPDIYLVDLSIGDSRPSVSQSYKGLEFIQTVRSFDEDAIIIIVTAHAAFVFEYPDFCSAYNVSKVLTKPVDKEILLKNLQELSVEYLSRKLAHLSMIATSAEEDTLDFIKKQESV